MNTGEHAPFDAALRARHAEALEQLSQRVRAQLAQLHPALAGTGPLRETVSRAGAEVLGWVDHARLAGLYRRARALLFPPRWQEPFGIAGLEALAFGVPVVAWRSGGVAEWHPGPLLAWGDAEGLAARLERAVDERPAPLLPLPREAMMRRLEAVYASAA